MQISELESIRRTVSKYGEGITKGDLELLRSAFHPKAMMYGCSGDSVTVVEIEGLYAYVANQIAQGTPTDQHRCFIRSISVEGNVASAEVLQENCYGVNYINHFQLLKIDNQWLIVSKAYDVVSSYAVEQTFARVEAEPG